MNTRDLELDLDTGLELIEAVLLRNICGAGGRLETQTNPPDWDCFAPPPP